MPDAMRRALPYDEVLTSACTSTSSGREPSMQHSTADPGALAGRSARKSCDGFGTGFSPFPVISNTPSSLTAPNRFFTAKGHNIPTFLVGHVTKDGSLAGPKALEHVVDTVLYFEGERHHSHRVVRAVKNRFGAVSELGVFEMTARGLRPVPNPSKLFLAERPADAPGSAVLCSVEGSRPILVEVQALVSTSNYGTARRMASGIDQQRLSLLLAVLEKRAGLNLAGDDVFVNIAGGMTIDEPASDLGVLAAIASSVRNRVIPPTTAMFGEIGLAGEVRGITQAALRVREAAQMGFRQVIMPEANIDPSDAGAPAACELVGIRTVGEALDALLH